MKDLTDPNAFPQLSKLCLIDDRSHAIPENAIVTSPQDEVSQQNETLKSSYIPRMDIDVYRQHANELELYHRLLEKISF
jgi:hypothetical protein